jgi:hypothetical protein
MIEALLSDLENKKTKKMISRTFIAVPALVLCSLFTVTNVSAQSKNSYHHHIQTAAAAADSSDATSHLQIAINQPSKDAMKFRISILNPQGHAMTVSILKGEDVLFSENLAGEQYFNTFNMTQLEDGDYKVIVYNAKERIVKNLHLQTETTVDRQISIN